MQIDKIKAMELISYLPSRPDYEMWISVISAVGNHFSVYDALDIILSHWKDEIPNETEYKLKHRLEGYQIGTLMYYAVRYGYNHYDKSKYSNKKIYIKPIIKRRDNNFNIKKYTNANCIKSNTNDCTFSINKYPIAINTEIINKGICRHTGEINNYSMLAGYFTNVYFTLEQILAHISVGHPVIFGHFRQGNAEFIPSIKSKYWLYSKLFAIDIDNGLSIDDALQMNSTRKALFIYTTCSHTETKNKFRIVFNMEGIIENQKLYRDITTAYINEYKADTACKNVNRIFFGNDNARIILTEGNQSIKVKNHI
jgi:hypothetical protein